MEGIFAVTMPKWGMSMTEGRLSGWLVRPGRAVEPGMEILEIETDKITNVLEARDGGILRRQVIEEGQTVPVGALLGVIADASVPDDVIDAFVAERKVALAGGEGGDGGGPQVIDIGGRSIRVLDLGAPGTEAFVLVHGFGGDLNNWLFNAPGLAEVGRVLALDLPGHGESTKDVGTGDVSALVGALVDLIGQFGLERVHLVGHSMGGLVAALAGAEIGGRLASLSLVAPAGLAGRVNDAYIGGFIAAEKRKDLKPWVELLFADPALVTRDMVEGLLNFKRLDGVQAALALLRSETLAKAAGLEAVLAGLDVPAVILWGDQDKIIAPPAAAPKPLRILPGKGHMLHMEAAAEVTRAIRDVAGL
ncbi:acetoin dehydrogenase dihydrolipoyllysine-residue acetyltransferase subunit [Zavarzinia compransoris]|uniref:Acetoin dehydrogenase dihydrolipoyllysine-residue acetyltransferase subunit n=1 Tax=Zavarzinia compransoris TaxID=1264899 RepID=A0A317E4X5_9PROT|nr:acetoin dehydrogenase dihydrolipoyllysine-residue acetyltransferase subunit [Zavarzinia compransoris]PWR21622.1 acetoin dehydrogenase dihydrolipoyllysine-residue acetyltransferase subunit [Zavarzinia compransoris]TDP45598.1 pyruvate dehydrogenase E2 component (dihydrolipoamide acetyltransferase) [Zavarzinia compransoris]